LRRAAYALLAFVLLTLVYALVLASFAPLDLALGAIISACLLLALREGGPVEAGPGPFRRFIAFFPFVVAVLWEIVRGTWDVALVTLHLKPLRSPGVVVVPVGERTPMGVAVSSLCVTLSPGEFLVDVDEERGEILYHVIDASDPDAIREHHLRFYERYQRKVFP